MINFDEIELELGKALQRKYGPDGEEYSDSAVSLEDSLQTLHILAILATGRELRAIHESINILKYDLETA